MQLTGNRMDVAGTEGILVPPLYGLWGGSEGPDDLAVAGPSRLLAEGHASDGRSEQYDL